MDFEKDGRMPGYFAEAQMVMNELHLRGVSELYKSPTSNLLIYLENEYWHE